MLLDDPDGALVRWYAGFMTPTDPRVRLTAGPTPSPRRIAEVFGAWVAARSDPLRAALCGQFSGERRERGEMTEIAMVAALSIAIKTMQLPDQVDALTTASLLVTTRMLARLCIEQAPDADPDPEPDPDTDPDEDAHAGSL